MIPGLPSLVPFFIIVGVILLQKVFFVKFFNNFLFDFNKINV
jgi:hypothetical protein